MKVDYPPALAYLENQISAMTPEDQAQVHLLLLRWAAFHTPISFECEVDRIVFAVKAGKK